MSKYQRDPQTRGELDEALEKSRIEHEYFEGLGEEGQDAIKQRANELMSKGEEDYGLEALSRATRETMGAEELTEGLSAEEKAYFEGLSDEEKAEIIEKVEHWVRHLDEGLSKKEVMSKLIKARITHREQAKQEEGERIEKIKNLRDEYTKVRAELSPEEKEKMTEMRKGFVEAILEFLESIEGEERGKGGKLVSEAVKEKILSLDADDGLTPDDFHDMVLDEKKLSEAKKFWRDVLNGLVSGIRIGNDKNLIFNSLMLVFESSDPAHIREEVELDMGQHLEFTSRFQYDEPEREKLLGDFKAILDKHLK